MPGPRQSWEETDVGRNNGSYSQRVPSITNTCLQPGYYHASLNRMRVARDAGKTYQHRKNPRHILYTQVFSFGPLTREPSNAVRVMTEIATAPQVPASPYADFYIDEITFAISISLGIDQGTALAKSVHFLRVVALSLLIILASYYIESCIQARQKACTNTQPFLMLEWRHASKFVSFVRQFFTTIVVNVFATRMRASAGDETQQFEEFISRILFYTSAVVIVLGLYILFRWLFYEQPVQPQDDIAARLA